MIGVSKSFNKVFVVLSLFIIVVISGCNQKQQSAEMAEQPSAPAAPAAPVSASDPNSQKSNDAFIDNEYHYSIKYPDGWVISRQSNGATLAQSNDNRSFYKVLWSEVTPSDISIEWANDFGNRMVRDMKQSAPFVELKGAHVIKDFNGHPAMVIDLSINPQECLEMVIVPNGSGAYRIMFGGPRSVFKATMRDTFGSFKVL